MRYLNLKNYEKANPRAAKGNEIKSAKRSSIGVSSF